MKVLKKKFGILVAAIMLIPLLYVSCHRNEQALPKEEKDSLKLVKEFIYDYTKVFYLWEEFIPANIDIRDYEDPHKLFDDMYYPTLDHWSFVTDNYVRLQNSLDGKRKASGFRFRPFLYEDNSSEIYFLVEFVYPDGNAHKAGLKRGDVIIKVNGTKPTKENYSQLLSNDNLKLSIGEHKDGKVVDLNKSIDVTKIEQSFSPILQNKVIVKDNRKIGYFLFDQFISEYDDDMENVMKSFKDQGIDELVLDLRYNSGGYVSTCVKLGSMIAPKGNQSNIFLTFQWNDLLTRKLQNKPEELKRYFKETNANLNLQNLYVLSSKRTASASEAIINCLKPYMNVVLIGDTTAGKYTAVKVFSDDNKPPKHNWAIFLVTSRIANAKGDTDFINGFVPNYLIQDNLITPLGDENEPLLAKALELITGSTAKKAVYELEPNVQLLDIVYDNKFEKEGLMIID